MTCCRGRIRYVVGFNPHESTCCYSPGSALGGTQLQVCRSQRGFELRYGYRLRKPPNYVAIPSSSIPAKRVECDVSLGNFDPFLFEGMGDMGLSTQLHTIQPIQFGFRVSNHR